MLSERPNVRVHNDPLRMCPARESAEGGRETQGRLFFGSFLCAVQRNEQTAFRNHRRILRLRRGSDSTTLVLLCLFDNLNRRVKRFLQTIGVFTSGLGHFSLAAAAAVHNRRDLLDNRSG